MAKLNLGSYPHMLGFEQLERLLERAAIAIAHQLHRIERVQGLSGGNPNL